MWSHEIFIILFMTEDDLSNFALGSRWSTWDQKGLQWYWTTFLAPIRLLQKSSTIGSFKILTMRQQSFGASFMRIYVTSTTNLQDICTWSSGKPISADHGTPYLWLLLSFSFSWLSFKHTTQQRHTTSKISTINKINRVDLYCPRALYQLFPLQDWSLQWGWW